MVGVSIALVREGIPEVGVVYNPLLNEFFEAERGCGAQLNGETIHVTQESELSRSLLATGFAYNRRESYDPNYMEFCHFTNSSQGVRRLGAAAIDLAYLASGRLDGYWEHGLSIWDIAAGVLLVEEAGGLVTGYDLGPIDLTSGEILASNGPLHPKILKELHKAQEWRENHPILMPS